MSNRFKWAAESPSGYFGARQGRGRRTAVLFAAAASAILAGRARADTYYLQQPVSADWNSTGDGYFSWFDFDTSNPNVFVPPNGGTAYVLQSGTYGVSNTIVNYNNVYSSPGLSELDIESGNQVNQSSAASVMYVSGDTYIGLDSSSSGQYVQSAGTNSVAGVVAMGYTNGSTGTYTLSGQGSLVAGQIIAGWYGSGIFNQSGGVATVGSSGMLLGYEPGSSGTANISGGNFTTSGIIEDGYSGTGTFNHSGGTVHASYLVIGNGASPAGVGTYNLSNTANLAVDNDLIVGNFGTGYFNQFGGSASIGGFLLVGFETGSSGSVNLSGGYLNVSTEEDVGYNGTGQFYQSGGTNFIGNNNVLVLGNNVGSSGTYTLTGGVLTGPSDTFVGNSGVGSFVQTGGSHVSTLVIMGYTNGAFGTYALSGQGALIASQTVVGWYGSGLFNQSGGSASIQQLYLGYAVGGNGTVNLSGGSINASGTEYIAYGGNGLLSQTGGSNTTASLYIAYSNSAPGTYSLSAGVLTSNVVVNAGQFTQSGGTANLGVVTGAGAMTLGGAAELTSVTNFQQKSITINSGGYLAVASNATQYTNTVNSLTINGSGQLDLANHYLLTSTSPSLIRQYLTAGYNGGAWNGTGGISSISAASTNAGHTTALGYSSGTTIAALGLSPGQTLVKYTLYGDANLDGTVDISDLNIVLSNFLSGNPGTWDTGDFNYDGTTDITDLNNVLSNYLTNAPTTVRNAVAKASAASTAKTLTGTVLSADTVNPLPANGVLELVVNTTNGDVELEGNNADIASLQITSNTGGIITANWTDLKANGYSNWTDTAKKKTGIGEFDNQFTVSGDYAVLGVVDYGNIYNTTANAEDYVFKYGSVESNDTTVDTDVGSVIYVSGVPEPTTLGLMGLAAAGLMGRRRKGRR